MHHNTALSPLMAHSAPPFPRHEPGEGPAQDNDGLQLPVNPDQGTPLMPDEPGEITVPA